MTKLAELLEIHSRPEIGQSVKAKIMKNGHMIGRYTGIVVGFTKNNMVKIKSSRGIKSHSLANVTIKA